MPNVSPTKAAEELMEFLRNELEQYGQMLALLNQQQESIISRATEDVFRSASIIQEQTEKLKDVRSKREKCQTNIIQAWEKPADTPITQLIALFPEKFRSALEALIQENNQLLTRIQQRVRQNHILLSRSLELMHQMVSALIPAAGIGTYNGAGQEARPETLPRILYDAVG